MRPESTVIEPAQPSSEMISKRQGNPARAPILGIGLTASCALFYGFDKSALLVMVFLATAVAAVLTIYIGSLSVTLGSCQAPRG